MRKPIANLKLDDKVTNGVVNFILNGRYCGALTKLEWINSAYISHVILRIIFTNFLRIMLVVVMNNIFYICYYLNMFFFSRNLFWAINCTGTVYILLCSWWKMATFQTDLLVFMMYKWSRLPVLCPTPKPVTIKSYTTYDNSTVL
jgi:hypothetical protein